MTSGAMLSQIRDSKREPAVKGRRFAPGTAGSDGAGPGGEWALFPDEGASVHRENRSGSPSHEAPPDIPARKEGSAAVCIGSFCFIPFLLFPSFSVQETECPKTPENIPFHGILFRKQENLFRRRVAPQVVEHPLQQLQRLLFVFAGHADPQAEIVADQAVIL